MVRTHWTRRQWLAGAPATLGIGLVAGAEEPIAAKEPPSAKEPFGYCLNTSTLMGQKLDIIELVEIAAKAGYQALEPWISDLDRHVQQGGNLKVLGQRIRDRGLRVESAIAFPEWIVDDEGRRKKALEEMKRAMAMVRDIGGTRIAAPPSGATKQADLSLARAAERYRVLLQLGKQMGVVTQVELWGFSKSLSRLADVTFVAMESGHPQACILLDVYHLYKGGSPLTGLKLLAGSAMHVLHINDYPAQPPRAAITDAARIYPGDGIAPLKEILRDLRQIGYRGVLSLELFNRDYWKQDPLTVARTGLEKMRTVVRSSL